MTPGRQRTMRRRAAREGKYYTRPADVPKNAHAPKRGRLVQHAMTENDGIVYRSVRSLNEEELSGGRGWIVRDASITRITQATAKFTHLNRPMPRRTVANRLAAMQKKWIIQRYDVGAHRNNPFGTTYFIPPFKMTLDVWKRDPEVETVDNNGFYVIGRGRHLVSPAVARAWNIIAAAAAVAPAAQVTPADVQELPAARAARAPVAPPAAPMPITAADLEPLQAALSACCGGATPADTQFYLGEVQKHIGAGVMPPIPALMEMLEEIARNWRRLSPKKPMTHALAATKTASKADAWHRRQKAITEAQAAQRQQGSENSAAAIREALAELARDDLPDEERARIRDYLAVVAPDALTRTA